jgi:hypothetical protein
MDNVSTRTTAGYGGGGVAIRAYASFTMSGGEISGNVAGRSGGGVFVYGQNDFNLSVFTMTGGDIKNNRAGPGANAYGGGVHLNGYCTFTMTGGTISGNTIPCTANSAAHTTHNSGAGIYASGNFFMGGSARVTADNEIALVASSTQLTTPRPLTICEPFTASPAGPVAKIELLGKGTYANPSLRWPGEQVIALGEGVSGGDIGRFTLGNFRMGAGASAFDQPITETCHIDDDGYLRLNGGE